jgi:hypothetical protein
MTVYVYPNKNQISLPTCETHCELYDPIEQACSIYGMQKDMSDPYTALTCEHILYKMDVSLGERIAFDERRGTAIEEEIWETNEMFESFLPLGAVKPSQYPLEPDIPCPIVGAKWFVSPCGTFGCWILFERPRLMSIPDPSKVVRPDGRFPNHYASPVPLHNHKAHEFLRSYMVWYVHPNGTGEYRVIQGNGTLSPSLIHKSR